MPLNISKTTSLTNAGTPVVTVNKGASDKAPLLVEFMVDVSSCTFDNTEDYDATFDEDYSGKTHDPSKHRILYLWDLDDSETNWTAPENIPAEYANRSKALGQRVQHVYTTAQTVNWKLEIWEPTSGKKAYASGSFTVVDPLETADHIVLVNPNGDSDFTFSNPGSAIVHQEQLASGNLFNNITAAYSSYAANDNVCWLFKAGGAYNVQLTANGTGLYPYIGQYSAGSQPVFTVQGSSQLVRGEQKLDGATVAELRIQNIEFRGNWTTFATTLIPTTPSTSSIGALRAEEGWRTIVADSRFDSIFGRAIEKGGTNITDAKELYIGVANCVLHNIAGYQYPTIFGQGTSLTHNEFCFVGNRFTDEPTTITTNSGRRAFIRHNHPTYMHIRGCDFFRQADGSQPIIKANKGARFGAYIAMQFCVGEGPGEMVNFTEQLGTGQSIPVNDAGIIECCMFLHNWNGRRMVGIASSSVTIRSCYVVSARWATNVSNDDAQFRSRGFILPDSDGDTYPTGDEAPIEIYNCHEVHNRTTTQNANGVGSARVLPDAVATNSDGTVTLGDGTVPQRSYGVYVHAPNIDSPNTVYAPVANSQTDTADGILRADGNPMRFRFTTVNIAGTQDATFSLNNDVVPNGSPETGSAALGSATGLVWPLDYSGRLCGPNRSFGASDRPDYVFDVTASEE